MFQKGRLYLAPLALASGSRGEDGEAGEATSELTSLMVVPTSCHP